MGNKYNKDRDSRRETYHAFQPRMSFVIGFILGDSRHAVIPTSRNPLYLAPETGTLRRVWNDLRSRYSSRLYLRLLVLIKKP